MNTAIDEAGLMPKDEALEALRAAVVAYNAERGRVTRDLYMRLSLFFVGYLLLGAFALYYAATQIEKNVIGIVLVLIVLGGAGVWRFCVAPSRQFQQTMRDRMLPIVFGFVSDVRYVHGVEPAFIKTMPGKELVVRDRSQHGDMIAGVHDGLTFTFSETELTAGSGKSKHTTFKGVIFHFLREQAFPGLLLAARKPNSVQRFMRDLFSSSTLALVTSGNPEVDASHEFRTNQPQAATALIEGTLAKALDYLASEWRDDVVRIALTGHEVYLLVPTKKDFFELPPVDMPVDFDRHIRPMIRDLITLLATAHLVNRIG